MLEVHRVRHLQWAPTAIVALVASPDGRSVAAARESGAIEIWNVAPGSVGWYIKLTIPGTQKAEITSLIWCSSTASQLGRLFSAGLDGLIVEYDLDSLRAKAEVNSLGGAIWNLSTRQAAPLAKANGVARKLEASSDSETDSDNEDEIPVSARADAGVCHVAAACDDGSVRLFTVDDGVDGMTFKKALPHVDDRILSVAWSADGSRVYAGGSDGCIRCWDVTTSREVYRITAGTGGRRKPGTEFCVWTLLALRNGTLVSGDSTGATQFWDENGTLLKALSHHTSDVLALAPGPSEDTVFSGGADGQVAVYKLVKHSSKVENTSDICADLGDQWTYLGARRPHTHDVRALVVAVPLAVDSVPTKAVKKVPGDKQPDHRRWALPGIPMLVSGGNDTKLFAYSGKDMLTYQPHDICFAPERTIVQLAPGLSQGGDSVIMVQHSTFVDIWKIPAHSGSSVGEKRKRVTVMGAPNKHREQQNRTSSVEQIIGERPVLLARIKSKDTAQIGCSALAGNGKYLAFCCRSKPRLFELDHQQSPWTIKKRSLPASVSTAQQLVFSADSTRLIVACAKSEIMVLDLQTMDLLHVFKLSDVKSQTTLAPVTLLCASPDGQWLAVGSSEGQLTVLNLEVFRHHWSVPLFDGSPATGAAFHPGNNSALILTTAANRIIVVDIQAKQLGRWSQMNLQNIPQQVLQFPGGITGLTLCPSEKSTQMIAYSARAMCLIDFKKPMQQETPSAEANGHGNGVHGTANGVHGTANGVKPRNGFGKADKNLNITFFDDPVLFMGYTSPDSLLIVEKPWLEVLRQLPPPVYKHSFGT